MAANHLQQSLDTLRRQVTIGEEAFDRWQASFRHVEAEITRRLERLNGRLGATSRRPRLRVVVAEEIAAI
jgi:hypothetical protein